MATRRYFGGFTIETDYENHKSCTALLDRLIEFCECNEEDHKSGNLTPIYAYEKVFYVCSTVAEMAYDCGFNDKPEYGATTEDYEVFQ